MLCLVKLPNSIVLEVEVSDGFRSKGQECLDKVCQLLGIIEVDYFGLQYHGTHGELLWLNLRNPIKQQIPSSSCGNGSNLPLRLLFKVKFFVPPHLLLQDTTRHQFFLNIVSDLKDGRLRVPDKDDALKVTSLLAQSELGDRPSLTTTSSTSFNLFYRKFLPLSLIEGSTNGDNQGQRIRRESSPITTSSSRMRRFRRHNSGPTPISNEVTSSDESDSSSILSMSVPTTSHVPPSSSHDASNLYETIAALHKDLKGMKSSHAKYLLLKEVSQLDDFGVEYFNVRSTNSSTSEEPFRLGVGPKGVILINETAANVTSPTSSDSSSCTSISYSSIHIATVSGRCLFLTYIDDKGDNCPLGFRCDSSVAANAIYRAVTEKHAFYSCETVRNAVTSQFIRDLKGTIVSLFNENTPLGKNYVFDIRRTCREVYDHTRRVLYQNSQPPTDPSAEADDSILSFNFGKSDSPEKVAQNNSSCCKNIEKKLATLQDSMLCRVCMDVDVSMVFFPCRHIVCCHKCSSQCESCPLCRTKVENCEKVYLPISGGHDTVPETVT